MIAGANIEEMTRRALVERPEDPRTAQLRNELEELRRVHEKSMLDSERLVRDLKDKIDILKSERDRASEHERDLTQVTQDYLCLLSPRSERSRPPFLAASLMEKESLPMRSLPRQTTRTLSPSVRTSSTCSMR